MLPWVRRAVWQASRHTAGAAEGTGASTVVFHSPVAGLPVARVALPCLAGVGGRTCSSWLLFILLCFEVGSAFNTSTALLGPWT